jgi:hypothetical protein
MAPEHLGKNRFGSDPFLVIIKEEAEEAMAICREDLENICTSF